MNKAICVLTVVVFVFAAAAQDDDCTTCGDTAPFAEAEEMVSGLGFSADSFDVLFAWQERVDDGYVTGLRVRDAVTGDVEDVYVSSDNELLTDAELESLGVRAKDWSGRPIQTFAHRATAVPRDAQPQRKSDASSAIRTTGPIDQVAVAAQDAETGQDGSKGTTRIGVFQDFDSPITVAGSQVSDGAWTPASGGYVWALTVFAEGAFGQRIHFTELTVPDGGQVVVYNADDPTEIYGPYTELDAIANELWSATCWSDLVTIECFAPSAAARDATALTIDRIVHMYRPLDQATWAPKVAGACNNDVSCFPSWVPTADGVGGLGVVGSGGSLFCTASLIADSDAGTEIPYVLAANHCVPGAVPAASIEMYWFYQTSVCEEPPNPPNPATVPRTTGGAVLLATTVKSTGTDFALLQLNNAPAPGAMFLGWTSAEAPIGTSVTTIHHPSGDFKRISFGTITNDTAEPLYSGAPRARYHQSDWFDGTTEPGSSGSPLFITATGQIIGQLWGGLAACSNSSPDYYGRFDVSYPMMSGFIGPAVPEIDLASSSINVMENAGNAVLNVTVSVAPGVGNSITVDYTTTAGTAVAGVDFTPVSGTLTISDNATSGNINIPIIDNLLLEADETLTLELSNPTGGVFAPLELSAVVTIQDDEVDTDGDGISDGAELAGLFGYITNPALQDTDGDGISDYMEIVQGTDPTNPGSTPALSTFRIPFAGFDD